MSAPSVLFVQKSPQQAGAQTSLWRLLAQPEIRKLNPSIVTHEQGWLSEACMSLDVPVFIQPFPKPRSLWGRTAGLWSFGEKLMGQVQDRGLMVQTVVGNDHSEAPFAASLAGAFGVPSALFLRDGGTTEAALRQSRCAEANLLLPVGQRLFDLAAQCFPDADIQQVGSAMVDTDYRDPKPQPAEFPLRILVIGKDHPNGGWGDVIAACDLLSDRAPFAYLILDILGPRSKKALAGDGTRSYGVKFIERSDDFQNLLRQYDLVIDPSHHLGTGIQAYEVLAAGVPLVTTGGDEIDALIDDDLWIYEPGHSTQLASQLTQIYQNWQNHSFPAAAIQSRLRKQLDVTKVARKVVRLIRALVREKA